LASNNDKKKSLRVTLIASENTVCEYSMFLEHLLVGLADKSIPVALICPPGFNPGTVFTGITEIINYPIFDLPLMELLNIRLLSERLAKFEPTILHCLCESRASLTKQLAHRLDLPYVLMVNSVQKRWSHFSISSTYCRRIIVPSKSIDENISSIHHRFSDRIKQINIGTFVAVNSSCFSDPNRLATMIVTDPFTKTDDFENLFNVFKHLLIDGYEFMVLIAEGGKSDRHLWKLMHALDILRTVIIIPRRLSWRSILAAGDVLIRTRPNYAFDPVLLQAMSIGAVVAGCKGGVDDLLIEDKTAVIFDPNDEMSIMRSLQQLLDRRELARHIAENAQQYLRENFSVSKMISATLEVYYESQR
jgi:glycosyltransferase involved in cell wall biosynthesis